MSQWGNTKIFKSDTAEIEALCDVDTKAFDPIESESKIWNVVVLNANGDPVEIERLTAEAKSYVGKSYTEWLR